MKREGGSSVISVEGVPTVHAPAVCMNQRGKGEGSPLATSTPSDT